MKDYDDLLNDLKFVDSIVGYMLPDSNLEFYLAGGSACILGGYLERATKDFDFIDIGYSSSVGKLLNYLQPYDLLDINNAEIPWNFKTRSVKLSGFVHINVYILCIEDIIASKIGRYDAKDMQDIDILIKSISLEKLKICIQDTQESIINENRKKRYHDHLIEFSNKYGYRSE